MNDFASDSELTPNGKLIPKLNPNGIKVKNESQKLVANHQRRKSSTDVSALIPSDDKPLTITVEINSIAWLLFAVAFGFRFYRLSEPSSVV